MILPAAFDSTQAALVSVMDARLLLSLRTAARAILRHPATQPDHLLIFADALQDTALELATMNSSAAKPIQRLSDQLRDIAPLLA